MQLFIAGATGATGQVLLPMATAQGHDLRFQVRPQTAPRTPLAQDPRARVFDLGDAAALKEALSGCAAAISLVGTMRARFQAGDTYESSDIASTRQLVEGAISACVPRLLLLSSYGAGGVGAYLKMKGECERIVKDSSLSWTIFRPSALVSPKDAPAGTHGARQLPAGIAGALGLLGKLPGLRGFADDVRPIPLEVLCRAMLRVAETPMDGQILSGRQLWQIGGAS